MKTTKLFFVCALALFTFSACWKDQPESATDPLPFPMEANKDLSTDPGDDFWQYCNGTWNANTPQPASGAVGGMYEQDPVIKAMENTLFAEDPSLHRYKQLMDDPYANSEAARAYLAEWRAGYPEPKTQEEFFRYAGRMINDGLNFLKLTFVGEYKEGIIVGGLAVPGSPLKYSYSNLDDSIKPLARWIAEGMQLDPESLYYDENAVFKLNTVKDLPVSSLNTGIESLWSQVYPYVDDEFNNSLGAGKWTPEFTKLNARASVAYELSNRLAVRYVSEELKQYYLDLVGRLREAFRNRIRNLDWMSETTRNNAIDKLDKMMVFVGYPDKWYDDCLPDLSNCKSLLEAVYKLEAARVRLNKHLVGTSDVFSQSLTFVYDPTGKPFVVDLAYVNAYYKRETNSICILPAMILPPTQRQDITEAHVYGAVVVAAHEITHGFDSEGAKYDGYGRIRNWWTVADGMSFKEEQQKLIACYNSLEFDPVNYPGKFTDGSRTLTENISDLGGFLMTLDAYSKRLVELGYNGENYDAQLRKFYESYADLWCMKYSNEKLASILQSDIHSHCRLRVNGVVMNTDEWYRLYDVDRNNVLYLPPERRTHIW